MRRTTFVLTVLLAVMTLASFGCADPAKDKPAAAVEEVQAVPEATPGAASYSIDPKSTIGFIGSKITGSHMGGFNEYSGTILVGDSPEHSSVEVEIDTDSLWSDDERLTGHLKSEDFFDTAAHPTASFRSTSIVADGEMYTLTGNLDLHGVVKSISFPAKIELSAEQATATAEFSIKRFDFNIEYKGKADDLIRDDVVIRLELVATPDS